MALGLRDIALLNRIMVSFAVDLMFGATGANISPADAKTLRLPVYAALTPAAVSSPGGNPLPA
jgi:hypothetical protein